MEALQMKDKDGKVPEDIAREKGMILLADMLSRYVYLVWDLASQVDYAAQVGILATCISIAAVKCSRNHLIILDKTETILFFASFAPKR